MARKRRPGGGRKPSGPYAGKTERFSTRIMRETREALEREAAIMNVGVSQAAERLLRLAMTQRRESEREPQTKALLFLIENLVKFISLSPGSVFHNPHTVPEAALDWRTDPFLFHAVRQGIVSLLDRIAPPGEMKVPQAVINSLRYESSPAPPATAKDWGELAATNVHMVTMTVSEIRNQFLKVGEVDDGPTWAAWTNEVYGFYDARKALGMARVPVVLELQKPRKHK